MALETREKRIGDYTYKVTQLGASGGRKLLVRLTQTLGPVLGALIQDMPGMADARKGGVSLMDIELSQVSSALAELAQRIREEDLEYICTTLGEYTEVELAQGKFVKLDKSAQELHFAGAYGRMFQWLGFALEVNYSDFFAAMPSLGKSPNTAAVTTSP